jgi:hypothetical protein
MRLLPGSPLVLARICSAVYRRIAVLLNMTWDRVGEANLCFFFPWRMFTQKSRKVGIKTGTQESPLGSFSMGWKVTCTFNQQAALSPGGREVDFDIHRALA